MSEGLLKTQIISPDNKVYDGNTEMVVLPGDEGDFAAMYEHAPIITFLRPGKVEVFLKEEKEMVIANVNNGKRTHTLSQPSVVSAPIVSKIAFTI